MIFCARPTCPNVPPGRPGFAARHDVFCANCWPLVPASIRARLREAVGQPQPLAAYEFALAAALEALRLARPR